MTSQYIRKWSLILSGGGQGIDLSQLKIKFKVSQGDVETPNTAEIRVYNLKTETENLIEKEYQQVSLQAGYEDGNYAVIFAGTIKQFRRGRESNLDSFLDIEAADGDKAYNFALVSKTLQAGATQADQAKAVAEFTSKYDVQLDEASARVLAAETGGILPRGKVLFGLARAQMRDICATTKTTWSIQNGRIVVTPLTGYQEGEAVELTAKTGLVGVPIATVQGIEMTCLLNPLISPGGRVHLNNADITTTQIVQDGFPRFTDINFVALTSRDGFYRVLVHDIEGDNRGQEWYSHLTCLAIDASAAPQSSVKAYG